MFFRIHLCLVLTCLVTLPVLAADEEGESRMTLNVCRSAFLSGEFEDIDLGPSPHVDLNGYLLFNTEPFADIDGAYLPRNYDNDIPDQNCDLPLWRSKTAAYNLVVGEGSTNVTLRFFDKEGNLVAEDTSSMMNIAPFQPFAALANALVPENVGDVQMVASSDGQPITGAAFIFNSGAEPAIGNATRVDFVP